VARVIGVDEAQARLLALATPLPAVELPLSAVVGHYLAENVIARRTQPAADLSAMDGYAIRFAELPGPWRVTGESAAGVPFDGTLGAGDAARIFTGAHVPAGADCILVQEEATREGDMLRLSGQGPPGVGAHIRRAGGDFVDGDCLLHTADLLNAGRVAVAAMAGYGALTVGGRPKVTILASGSELVAPGADCGTAQIPSSNNVMLSAMLAPLPCDAVDGGIIADDLPLLEIALRAAAETSDIIVTSGGASVGDHDLVQAALRNVGAEIDFWKVAMRPGKPIMAGRIGDAIVLGLPGNPSSAFVTAFLFLLPLVRHMAGSKSPLPDVLTARLAADLPAGGKRTDYFRAYFENGTISMFNRQDSGMLAPLSKANALLINPANALGRSAGSKAQYLRID
jgi:molybdopterin molybdotransferase